MELSVCEKDVKDILDIRDDLFLYVKNSPKGIDITNTKTWKNHRTGEEIEWSDKTLKLFEDF